MSSLPDYNKLPVEKVTVTRPSWSLPEDPLLCTADFFKECDWSWVGKGCLRAVEDQGKCCACWAFVGAEAITALYYIKLQKVKPLSKQQVINCLYTKLEEPKNIKYCEITKCFPSHYNKYYKFAIEEGIYSDKSYPYVEKRNDCHNLRSEEKTKIKEFKRVEDLKFDKGEIENLIRQQPISGCVKNVTSFKKHTGKDIYKGPTKQEIHFENELKRKNEPSEGRHAVLIVGFGIENGTEYYLIKNSWGVNWGYWGYARVERSVVRSLSFPEL